MGSTLITQQISILEKDIIRHKSLQIYTKLVYQNLVSIDSLVSEISSFFDISQDVIGIFKIQKRHLKALQKCYRTFKFIFQNVQISTQKKAKKHDFWVFFTCFFFDF